jgi:hypothetical protein
MSAHDPSVDTLDATLNARISRLAHSPNRAWMPCLSRVHGREFARTGACAGSASKALINP